MTTLSLRDAAQQTGVSKSTIFRAIRAGRLSASRTDDGGFAIDPAELFRVYRPAAERFPDQETGQDTTARATPEMAAKLAAAQAELNGARELLSEIRQARDDWRDQVLRLTAALPKPDDGSLADERARAQKAISDFKRLAVQYEARIERVEELNARPWWRRLVG